MNCRFYLFHCQTCKWSKKSAVMLGLKNTNMQCLLKILQSFSDRDNWQCCVYSSFFTTQSVSIFSVACRFIHKGPVWVSTSFKYILQVFVLSGHLLVHCKFGDAAVVPDVLSCEQYVLWRLALPLFYFDPFVMHIYKLAALHISAQHHVPVCLIWVQ